jgi:hypothetical protein
VTQNREEFRALRMKRAVLLRGSSEPSEAESFLSGRDKSTTRRGNAYPLAARFHIDTLTHLRIVCVMEKKTVGVAAARYRKSKSYQRDMARALLGKPSAHL